MQCTILCNVNSLPKLLLHFGHPKQFGSIKCSNFKDIIQHAPNQFLSCMGSTLKVQYAAARLRHASKFTLIDWEGPQRIPGEQNHTSLYTYLLGGESWQSCRLLQEIADEITQVGTEALNNWFHTAKVLQSMKVLMWKHCWVDNLFVHKTYISTEYYPINPQVPYPRSRTPPSCSSSWPT